MDILVYAVIAAILIYRLYTILGTKDGNEQQRPGWKVNPPSNNNAANKDELLALPLAAPKPAMASNPMQKTFAVQPAAESLAGAMFAIQKADSSFDERGFLKGARVAFEIIIRAFAAAERGTLKNLLTPKLYTAFEQALSERELRGERWEMKTLTLREMDVVDAKMDGSVASITVQAVSDQSKIIYDKNGVLINDPGRALERLTDRWTFTRDTKSQNPNWQLAETHVV